MRFRIVVTDVTIYSNTQRCVAGFDRERGVMIRPEPAPGEFWPAICCGSRTTFHPGHVVAFEGHRARTQLPHSAEDTVVVGEPARVQRLSEAAFKDTLTASLARSVEAVFGDNLVPDRAKAYVPAGTNCGSLAGLEAPGKAVSLQESEYDGERSLRATVMVGGRRLNLSVGAKDLKQAYRKGGLDAARELVAGAPRVHVRLGLARPWAAQPNRCYVQVNGIYPI